MFISFMAKVCLCLFLDFLGGISRRGPVGGEVDEDDLLPVLLLEEVEERSVE